MHFKALVKALKKAEAELVGNPTASNQEAVDRLRADFAEKKAQEQARKAVASAEPSTQTQKEKKTEKAKKNADRARVRANEATSKAKIFLREHEALLSSRSSSKVERQSGLDKLLKQQKEQEKLEAQAVEAERIASKRQGERTEEIERIAASIVRKAEEDSAAAAAVENEDRQAEAEQAPPVNEQVEDLAIGEDVDDGIGGDSQLQLPLMRGAIPDDEEVPIWDPEAARAAGRYVVDDDLLVQDTVPETDAESALKLQAEEYDRSRSPSPILGDDPNFSALGQDDVDLRKSKRKRLQEDLQKLEDIQATMSDKIREKRQKLADLEEEKEKGGNPL